MSKGNHDKNPQPRKTPTPPPRNVVKVSPTIAQPKALRFGHDDDSVKYIKAKGKEE